MLRLLLPAELRTIARSLTSIATATLIHCLCHSSTGELLHTRRWSPCRTPIGCLERVIRTAVRLIGGIPRTGRISGYMLDILLLLSLKHRIAVLQHWPGGVRSGLYLQNLCCRILGCQVFGI